MKHSFEKYCKNYQDIENYEAAKKDNFVGWECHHRLETHTPDGKRREVDISHKELKALGMYYNRPSEELIFLTIKEHHVFNKGKPGYWKGKTGPYKGKHPNEETRKKLREAAKGNKNFLGKKHSEESKKKMREAMKGKNIWTRGRHWYNNGKENKYCYECPDGFTPGMLRK